MGILLTGKEGLDAGRLGEPNFIMRQKSIQLTTLMISGVSEHGCVGYGDGTREWGPSAMRGATTNSMYCETTNGKAPK